MPRHPTSSAKSAGREPRVAPAPTSLADLARAGLTPSVLTGSTALPATPPLLAARPDQSLIPDVVALGDRVRAAREAMSKSQQDLATLSGVGRRFVSELENGKPTLEIGKVFAVLKACGVDLFAKTR